MKHLPNGAERKHNWLVVQDKRAKLEDIVNKFHILSKEIVPYQEGIQRALNDPRWICIADFGKGAFYLCEGLVNYLISKDAELEKFSKGWERVLLFLNHSTTEEYGFAVAEDGKIKRSYYVCKKEALFSFSGEPLEEEIRLGMNLPDGIWEALSSSNQEDEERIMKLALEMTGREEDFDYGDVVLLRVGLLR